MKMKISPHVPYGQRILERALISSNIADFLSESYLIMFIIIQTVPRCSNKPPRLRNKRLDSKTFCLFIYFALCSSEDDVRHHLHTQSRASDVLIVGSIR